MRCSPVAPALTMWRLHTTRSRWSRRERPAQAHRTPSGITHVASSPLRQRDSQTGTHRSRAAMCDSQAPVFCSLPPHQAGAEDLK
jgi:hypothetical protein